MSDQVDAILAQWATERPDLDVSPMGIVGRISRAAALLNAEQNRIFALHGLDYPAFDVLATLRRTPPPHRLTPGQLMESAMVTSGAITQRIARLESLGLVKRVRDGRDRRHVLVRLTAEGLAVIDRALPDHVANEKRLIQGIDPAHRRALADALRSLLESLGDTVGPADMASTVPANHRELAAGAVGAE